MNKELFFCLDGPIEIMPSEGQMRAASLSELPFLLRNKGADPRALLDRHNIDYLSLNDPDQFIKCQDYVNLLEDCSKEFNDPLFGLRLAQIQEPDLYGCVTTLSRASKTVGEAIKNLIEFLPVTHSPEAYLELEIDNDLAKLHWGARTNFGYNKQANYRAALINLKLLRQLAGCEFQPKYVNLVEDTRYQDIDELERILGCRFYNQVNSNAIVFSSKFLHKSVPTANRLVVKLLGDYLSKVKEAARISLVDRVQDYIRASLSDGNCSIERCAKKLDVSVRALQMKLAEAEISFSELLLDQRILLAQSYLKQQQLTLDDVAANLGYSEQSSFGRAFKRWTGKTPMQFRMQAD